jgi:RNA polymerase sigma factor (TIGR02999 family)
MSGPGEITRLLKLAGSGDLEAREVLADRVYADLERVAASKLRAQFGPGVRDLTLEPAALVNETFLKLLGRDYALADRREFFALATTVMLNLLVDYQRRKAAEKRGGGQVRITLSALDELPSHEGAYEITATVDALDRLAKLNPRHAETLRLRIVWGFTNTEIAGIVETSVATVERNLKFARTWLAAELAP